MKIQAVFWDYDNTLLETAEAHWKKHQVILAKHGIDLNEKYKKRIYENNGHQNWKWMQEELSLKVNCEEYLNDIDAELQRHMLNLSMRPGVEDLLKWIASLKIPQAIITNARKNSAKPILNQKKISEMMQLMIFKEDYEGRKPDPAPYLIGFKKMEELIGEKLYPSRCIAIEDDPKGVESAHKAGAIVIHRKLHENEQDCEYANYSCYHKQDFIEIVQQLVAKAAPIYP